MDFLLLEGVLTLLLEPHLVNRAINAWPTIYWPRTCNAYHHQAMPPPFNHHFSGFVLRSLPGDKVSLQNAWAHCYSLKGDCVSIMEKWGRRRWELTYFVGCL